MRSIRLLSCLAALVALGCDGVIMDPGSSGGGPGGGGPGAGPGGGGGPAGDPEALAEPRFHFAMTEASGFPAIRMMTHSELSRTVTDLTGVTPDLSSLPDQIRVMNLSNDARQVTIRDARHMRSMLELATAVASEADSAAVVGCAASCTRDEIGAFLERAFADHPSAAERDTYAGIHDGAAADKGDDFGRSALIQAVLISPRFLYRTEIGDVAGRLTATELARKLSYFLWGTRPDDALLAAALDGSLATDAVYREHVDRLLADPRTRTRFVELVFEWLGLDGFDLATKAHASELPDGIQADMEREVELLVLDVLFERAAPLSELFRSPTTFANERMAALYGLEGVTGSDFQEVSLEGTDRRGILTTALVLAAHGKEDGRSPMQRGKFLIDEVMCTGFPPEAGVAIMELPEGDFETFRDRFTPLETTAPCSNCHRVLNAGFAFDVFDTVGRRWPLDEVGPEEARGHFDLPPYDVLRFDTTVEAVEGFADHPALEQCFVAQTYRFAMGRVPGVEDADAFRALLAAFREGDQNAVSLLRDIALSERFRTAVRGTP
jgi:hypothetical protein